MTEFETANLALRGLIGLGQIGAILYGIHRMVQANDDRATQLDQQRHEAEQREKRADQRHDEAMEALRQQGEAFREQNEALRGLVKGMETVIERTAPKEQRPAAPGGKTP